MVSENVYVYALLNYLTTTPHTDAYTLTHTHTHNKDKISRRFTTLRDTERKRISRAKQTERTWLWNCVCVCCLYVYSFYFTNCSLCLYLTLSLSISVSDLHWHVLNFIYKYSLTAAERTERNRKNSEKYFCQHCGKELSKNGKSVHIKSAKCLAAQAAQAAENA